MGETDCTACLYSTVQPTSHVNCPGIDLTYFLWDCYQTKKTVLEVKKRKEKERKEKIKEKKR